VYESGLEVREPRAHSEDVCVQESGAEGGAPRAPAHARVRALGSARAPDTAVVA